jgi:glycosyltransferase involved in cell wall biosynthesis
MSKPKISVIIPVYNAENTIDNILDILITQDYENIEIVAVNDGSKDGSLEVLRKFAKKDKRMIIVDQKNTGASTARNVGVKESTGEFITFIDSDDDISERLISELASRITNDSDFIMCGMTLNGKEVTAPDTTIEGKNNITQYVLNSLLTKNLLYGPCCKLFRRKIVVNNKIKFPASVKYGEDTIFVLEYLSHSKNLANVNASFYKYYLSTAGISSNNNTDTSFRRARTSALKKYLNNNLSAYNISLYILLRLRWSMSVAKSNLRVIRKG